MPTTSAYQAGFETTFNQISYGIETTWGTAPATQFQAIRFTSETLSSQKQRDRPSEIPQSALEVMQAVTTKVSAGGDINYALSYGTFDDFFAGALQANWQAKQVINGAAGDITITSGTNVLSSTTSNKFQNISIGQFVRTLGFTNAGNNNIWKVTAKPNNQTLTLSGPGTTGIVTETPAGTNAKVRASTIINSNLFQSFYLQQKFNSTSWLAYPGAFCTGFSLAGGVGQFLNGKFSFLAQQELFKASDSSTGGILAAPTGGVHDPVNGFVGMWLGTNLIGAMLDSFSIDVSMKNAAAEYGMGSPAAAGVIQGILEAKGTLKIAFKDNTVYNYFVNETQSGISILTRDPSGQAYVFSLLNAALMNPRVETPGPSQLVYATFEIEGNPQAAGGSIQIDRLDAS